MTLPSLELAAGTPTVPDLWRFGMEKRTGVTKEIDLIGEPSPLGFSHHSTPDSLRLPHQIGVIFSTKFG